VSSIPTAGETINLGCPRTVVVATGTFTGVSVANKPTSLVNTFDLNAARGIPLPWLFRWNREAASSGSVTLLGWDLGEDEVENLADVAALAATFAAGGAASGGGTSTQPTQNFSRTATIPGGGTGTYTWQIGGFLYATIKNRAGNAGTVTIGESVANANFELPVGAAVSGIVGDGLVFGFSGTAGDIIEVLEFGRP